MLTTNPIFGAIGIAVTLYLALVIFVPWEQIIHKKPLVLQYLLPAIICPLVVCPMWNKLIAIFPSNSLANVFVNQTNTKNPDVLTEMGYSKYELLVELGSRYHDESAVDLEVNVGNAWKGIEAWWDKPRLTEKHSSFTPLSQSVNIRWGNLNTDLRPRNPVLDVNNPPTFKLKFDGIPIVPEERSLYLRFQGDNPLSLKSVKFKGKSL